MSADNQNVIALTAVALALGYLTWQGWRVLARRKAGCRGCEKSCAAAQPDQRGVVPRTDDGRPFVPIEFLKPRAPQ